MICLSQKKILFLKSRRDQKPSATATSTLVTPAFRSLRSGHRGVRAIAADEGAFPGRREREVAGGLNRSETACRMVFFRPPHQRSCRIGEFGLEIPGEGITA